MTTVRISFTPDPAYVRTIRTVAVAVARRAGVADDLLDAVRLAIGEACTRAVRIHRREGLLDLIGVAMSLVPPQSPDPGRIRSDRARRAASEAADPARFTVRVSDRGSADEARKEQAGGTGEIVARAAVVPSSGDDTGRTLLDEELLTVGVGIALLGGLAADLAVEDATEGGGTDVCMSWPVVDRPATSRGRRAAEREARRDRPRPTTT